MKYHRRLVRVDPRDDDEDDTSGFVVASIRGEDGDALIDSMEVPNNFVIAKIRELIDELSASADEFTAIRIGQFSFALGVFKYLQIDPAMGHQYHYKKPHEYRWAEANKSMEHHYA
ncbi:MAG: hypothetical protein ABSD90_14180 [Methylocystis sp.]